MKDKKSRSLGRPRSGELKQPTNEIIINAATQLFLNHGYKQVSVDDVAKQCDVTKATVYYYYPTKAELFTEAMIQMMGQIRDYMNAMLMESKPLRERLLKIAKAHLQATVDIDLEGFMRETRSSLTEEQVIKIQQAEEKMFFAIEAAFSEAIKSGDISQINSKFAAHAYISLLKVGNYRNAKNEGIFPSVDETAEQIVTLLWNGLFGS
ncbi:TetR/AcrR family transcriptional regulator [Aquibacillus sp. 3ASR75-11]|uniref:TetR/AcrR family transcriptional regulator n=1 Tax=Terrihalobacillus insolitus TaxID=2950438 RepID=A0A9X3WU51_9BACI|nr:TetR/AcrR family transcriptional regulator [Terrihalobacillus insolitus]MDC3411950.1 TetR/AcrR family transcriptional regulator [Terrihalobacillus insolitus]MDC3423364.1 TetR/AcrR family transcriptional regulator [Terrihalobacillus insolitus]